MSTYQTLSPRWQAANALYLARLTNAGAPAWRVFGDAATRMGRVCAMSVAAGDDDRLIHLWADAFTLLRERETRALDRARGLTGVAA